MVVGLNVMKFDLSTQVIDDTYTEIREAHVEQMLGSTDDDHVLKLVKELRGIRAFITILKARVTEQTEENQAPPLVTQDLRESII